MQEMIKNGLLSSAVYPLIVGFFLAFAGSRLPALKGKGNSWLTALALLLAFFACFYTTEAFEFPPKRVFSWIPLIALAAYLLLVFTEEKSIQVRCISFLPVILGSCWLFLKPVGRSWSTQQFGVTLLVCSLVLFLLWWAVDAKLKPSDMPTRTLLMVIASTGVSLVSVIGESAKSAQVSGGLAAASGSLFLVWLVARHLSLGSAAYAIFHAAIGCLLLNAFYYVEVPWFVVGLAAVAQLGPVLLRIPVIESLTGIKKTVLVCLLTLLPVLAALITQQVFAPKDEGYDY